MSEKNILQEYCQKNNISLPIYSSWSEGLSHQLSWSANVTVIINNKNIVISTIVPTNSKISAEKQAASLMIEHIKSIKDPDYKPSILKTLSDKNKLNIKSTHNINYQNIQDVQCKIINVYIIDLENKPCFNIHFKNDSVYIGFINSIHNSLKKYHDWHICTDDNISVQTNNKLLYIIDGGVSDLVDHFITLLIYPLIDYINSKDITSIYIVSGDHAGWCTRTCLQKVLEWKNINKVSIYNVATID